MKTILLIEDNADIRENLAEILELSDYKVISAADGKEGVALAIENEPDIIVCDIMMPVLDGYGVIHLLQKNEKTRNTPFIFLTAKAERADMRKGMELGADDYITKPFNGTELLNAIESRLKKSELLKHDLAPGLEGLDALITTAAGESKFKDLAKDRDANTYKKKQIIYTEGNHPHKLFYIVSGKVKVFRTNDDGKELIIAIQNEGEFVGYTALLESTVYRDTAQAMEETELAEIPKDEFMELMTSNRDIMSGFIKILANNVTEREKQLLAIAYNSLRKKVAESLVMVNRKYKKGNDAYMIDISRENLANIAGVAKESLIRTLSDFKDERLIDIRSGDIVIIDEKKLERMIN